MKAVKKITALAAVAVLAISMVACGGGNNIAGKYKLSGYTDSSGTAYGEEEMAMMEAFGLSAEIELKSDGSAVLNIFGVEMTGSYDEKSITFEGQSVPIEVNGKKLTMGYNGETLEFTKQ